MVNPGRISPSWGCGHGRRWFWRGEGTETVCAESCVFGLSNEILARKNTKKQNLRVIISLCILLSYYYLSKTILFVLFTSVLFIAKSTNH
jgi:hypothetical protein